MLGTATELSAGRKGKPPSFHRSAVLRVGPSVTRAVVETCAAARGKEGPFRPRPAATGKPEV